MERLTRDEERAKRSAEREVIKRALVWNELTNTDVGPSDVLREAVEELLDAYGGDYKRALAAYEDEEGAHE